MLKSSILIIDDDVNNLATLSGFLENENVNILVAEDGKTGIARAIYTVPDLILLDYMMPGITGVETCHQLKSNDITKDIPVIFVTALSDQKSISAAFDACAVDYVTKPVFREEFLSRVRVHLGLAEYKRKLSENNALRNAVFSSIQDGIMVFDLSHKLIKTNTAADALFSPVISEDRNYKMCLKLVMESYSSKATVKLDRQEWTPGGNPHKIASLVASPLNDPKGVCFGTVLVIRDETQIESLERSVKQGHKFNMIGVSEQIRKVYSAIDDLAMVSTTALISGESGTGKELVARAIHSCSERSEKPFVALNCAALPDDLLASELFGHVKGAFTGAVNDRKGRFEIADKGTLFLDEIGDISPKMQVMLLRVIQEQEFERSGESSMVKVDTRIIAATNKDLSKAVREGSFREDLFYRLNIYPVVVPPLRDRAEDIPLLAAYFAGAIGRSLKKNISVVSDEVVNMFLNYPWPGNIRELRNVIEHAVIKSSANDIAILPDHLPNAFTQAVFVPTMVPTSERDKLIEALNAAGGNKKNAAKALGIDRSTYYRKLAQYGIS